MSNTSRHAHGPVYAMFAVLVLLWGYNWVVMKIALRYAAPLDFAALRTLFASLCLLLPLGVFRRSAFWPRHPRATLLLGLLQTGCFVGLVNLALVHGDAGKSSVLVYSMPFWICLLAPWALHEKFRRAQLPALVLALAGLLLILAPWQHSPNLASSLLALCAGLAWALSVLLAKRIPISDTWELLSLTAWQMLFGALALALMAALIPSAPIVWSGEFIAALLYNIVPGNALAWFLWLVIVNRLPASVSSMNALAVPVVGVLAGWWQLGEQPTPLEGGGMLLVFAALVTLALSQRRRIAQRD